MAEGCRIDLGLGVVAMTEEDAEFKCITQNQEGRREAVIQLQMEGDWCFYLLYNSLNKICK